MPRQEIILAAGVEMRLAGIPHRHRDGSTRIGVARIDPLDFGIFRSVVRDGMSVPLECPAAGIASVHLHHLGYGVGINPKHRLTL